MADDAELKLDNGGGKKKLFIIIGAVVLLVVVGVVVFMMMGSSEPQESEQTQQLLAESNKIFYVSIPSPIVLKVVSKPKGHIMQLRLSLMVRGEENKKLAEHHLPAILSAISSSLYDLDFAEVQTPEGKVVQFEFKGGFPINNAARKRIAEGTINDAYLSDYLKEGSRHFHLFRAH